MAVGDLITRDHQYEYCGLLMGSGTPYMVEDWDGLLDQPNIRSNDLNRNDTDGVVPGQDLYGSRTITGKLHLLSDSLSNSTSAMYDAIEAWQTAMRAKQIEFPFVYKLPGRAKRYINCRPRKSSAPKDYELARGHGVISVQLSASQPWHYDLASSTYSIGILSGFDNQNITMTLPSNWPTRPVFTISGYAVNPMISVGGQTPMDGVSHNGRVFGLNVTLGIMDQLVIDMANKMVTLNGSPRPDLIRTDAQWWHLFPGQNQISYQRNSDRGNSTASPASMVFNSHWMY